MRADRQLPSRAHGEDGLIYWRELDADEAAQGKATPGKSKEDIAGAGAYERANRQGGATFSGTNQRHWQKQGEGIHR